MHDMIVKRQWTNPQLVIIERGLPGEQVLTGCKTAGDTTITNPQSGQQGCDAVVGTNCGACQSRGGS